MNLGIVVGQVVATRKDERLVGSKLLVIDPLDSSMRRMDDCFVAVDTVGAGVGETVLFTEGYSATRAFANPNTPVDAAVVGIVDSVDRYDVVASRLTASNGGEK